MFVKPVVAQWPSVHKPFILKLVIPEAVQTGILYIFDLDVTFDFFPLL